MNERYLVLKLQQFITQIETVTLHAASDVGCNAVGKQTDLHLSEWS
jgi:hypothetical protein